ncbi:MAG: EF-hand domain-containing protein [Chitinophagales bacterium]
MNKLICILLLSSLIFIYGCSDNKLEKKGFSVSNSNSTIEEDEEEEKINGLREDVLLFETRPRNVLLTGIPEHRLTPIFKVNYDKKTKVPFVGSNGYHTSYREIGESKSNQWNNNIMPGFEAVYGYNFVNVSHYNLKTQTAKKFFEKPVLIKTLYYPTFSKDTLNNLPVLRNHYMVSAYDEDTNKDGFINVNDLRRFYFFDINAGNKAPLIPKNYSVMSSEYDPANDIMYVFAKMDENKNGKIENSEDVHVFWIDLNNPKRAGRKY